MRAAPHDLAHAEATLTRDPDLGARFAELVALHGPCTLRMRRTQPRSHFESLARTITFQQLAGRAAATIWERFRATVDGRFTPETVLAVPDAALRAAGLSASKAASIRDLALHVADGSLPLARIARLDDDAVIERLSRVRGIGRWTAEMFLMFRLGRPDVWPAGDLGVRKGYALIAGLADPPRERDMPALGERFAPHRSVAAWYCWRAVDTFTPD